MCVLFCAETAFTSTASNLFHFPPFPGLKPRQPTPTQPAVLVRAEEVLRLAEVGLQLAVVVLRLGEVVRPDADADRVGFLADAVTDAVPVVRAVDLATIIPTMTPPPLIRRPMLRQHLNRTMNHRIRAEVLRVIHRGKPVVMVAVVAMAREVVIQVVAVMELLERVVVTHLPAEVVITQREVVICPTMQRVAVIRPSHTARPRSLLANPQPRTLTKSRQPLILPSSRAPRCSPIITTDAWPLSSVFMLFQTMYPLLV